MRMCLLAVRGDVIRLSLTVEGCYRVGTEAVEEEVDKRKRGCEKMRKE